MPGITRPRRPGLPGRPNRPRLGFERLEDRQLLATYLVTNTGNSGDGSLLKAIQDANAHSGTDQIAFNIPPTDSGFNPAGQTWTINLAGALPTITNPVLV